MASRKTRPRAKTHPNTPALRDLFLEYAIPPSPLHQALQQAAKQEGWVPPWENKEKIFKTKIAGEKSGRSRRALAQIRHSLIMAARAQLKASHQTQPYADESVDALHDEYLNLLTNGDKHSNVLVPIILGAMFKTDREKLITIKRDTLINDMKQLGIRSKRKIKRSR